MEQTAWREVSWRSTPGFQGTAKPKYVIERESFNSMRQPQILPYLFSLQPSIFA